MPATPVFPARYEDALLPLPSSFGTKENESGDGRKGRKEYCTSSCFLSFPEREPGAEEVKLRAQTRQGLGCVSRAESISTCLSL